MDWDLPDRLLKRLRCGESRQVPHASPSDLGQFQAERSKCHDNVNRWCHDHSNDISIKGWLVTGTVHGAVFDKHSVINRGQTGLLDITPLPDRAYSTFLIYEGSQEEYDSLPNQIISTEFFELFPCAGSHGFGMYVQVHLAAINYTIA